MLRTVLLVLALLSTLWIAGGHFDPAGTAITVDAGNQLDPNGSAATGDAGNRFDPDGSL